MEPEHPKPVAAAAVVALRGDSVLLAQRGREPGRGQWSLPGGSIEPGETAREAAAREAWEETGLRLRVLDVVDVFDVLVPAGPTGAGFHYCVTDFLAEPEHPEAEPRAGDDAMAARWVPVAEVERLGVTDALRTVLRRALWLRAQRRPPFLGAPATSRDLLPEAPRDLRAALRGALYVITDDRGPGRSHEQVARAALAGGARLVQVRDKRLEAADLVQLTRRVAALARERGALCLVNDRVDVAAAAGADGAHLGQTDIDLLTARRLLGPDTCLGVSVEDPEQARQAEAAGADYLGVGDLFGTGSKADAGAPVGLDHLRRIRAATRLPLVAIGGIILERVEAVIEAGADAAAVIAAVAAAPDMEAAARALSGRAAAAWARVHA